MFTVILFETSTKGGRQPIFPAFFPEMPAQKTREQPPQFQQPLGLFFFLVFTVLVIRIERRNINTTWG